MELRDKFASIVYKQIEKHGYVDAQAMILSSNVYELLQDFSNQIILSLRMQTVKKRKKNSSARKGLPIGFR